MASFEDYLLHLADNTLILGQRLSEWCGHGPVLEEDIALTNTALDYIGQATNLYKYMSETSNNGKDEDQIAFIRDAWEFRNVIITELPNGDYAKTIARQYFFSVWYALYLRELQKSSDEFLRGFAEKSSKEVRYHVQHSGDWILRLGDGTEESHQRLQDAVNELWTYTGEMFLSSPTEKAMADSGIAPNNESLRDEWKRIVSHHLSVATIQTPEDAWMHSGGKVGKHSEHLGFILADMQFLQRAYPGAKW